MSPFEAPRFALSGNIFSPATARIPRQETHILLSSRPVQPSPLRGRLDWTAGHQERFNLWRGVGPTSTPVPTVEVPLTASSSSAAAPIDAVDAAIAREFGGPLSSTPYPTLSLRDLWRRPSLEWRIEGVIHTGACCVVFGPSRAGKSFIGRDWALAVAHGYPWAGHPTQQGPVLYIAAEGGDGLGDRFRAWFNFNDGDDDAPLEILEDRPDLVAALAEGDLGRVVATVREFVMRWGALPAVIFIDTLAKCFGIGDENSARDMGRFVANCETLSRISGTAVVVIHHSGKDASKGPRGSGALHAGFIATFEVRRQGQQVVVSGQKQKDGPELPEQAFEMIEVAWSDLKDRKPHSSCLLLPAGTVSVSGAAPAPVVPAKPDAVAVLAAFGPLGLTGADWERQAKEAGIARSTFFEARKKAIAAGRVIECDGRFIGISD